MTPTAKRFVMFFLISSMMACSFYFAWAWSRGVSENAALRSQVTSLSEQSKNTEAAIASLRAKEEEAEHARKIEGRNELNLKQKYLDAREESGKLELELAKLKEEADDLKAAAEEAQKKLEKAEKDLKDKDVIVASQWRRIERLENRTKSLDQEKEALQKQEKIRRETETRAQEEQAKLEAKADADEAVKKTSQALHGKQKELESSLKKKDQIILKLESDLEKSRQSEKRLKEELKNLAGKKSKPQTEFRDLNSQVRQLSLDAATAHYNLGVLYMRAGQHKNAAAEFEYSLATNPSDSAAHYNLAVLLDAYLGDAKRAIQHYEAYIRLQPKAEDLKKVQYRVFRMKLQQEKGVGRDLSREVI